MALPGRPETVTIRDASIIFRNFKGERRQYNNEGDRNFSLMLDEPTALEMQNRGWNVKPLKQREDEEQQLYHLKVSVSFTHKPPRCFLLSSSGRSLMGEGMVGMFDDLTFTKIDLIISAYDWNVNGNTGRKAYLQSFFGTMYEDELELEYAAIPQITVAGGDAPRELEPGARRAYDYDGEVVSDEEVYEQQRAVR